MQLKKLQFAAFIAVVLMAFVRSLAAQASTTPEAVPEPSLAETMDFLATFVPTHFDLVDPAINRRDTGSRVPLKSGTADSCTLLVTSVRGYVNSVGMRVAALYAGPFLRNEQDWQYAIDFRSIDPLEPRETYSGVVLHSSAGKPTIQLYKVDYSGETSHRHSNVPDHAVTVVELRGTETGDAGHETAQRLQKAVTHALKLCGAKVSPF